MNLSNPFPNIFFPTSVQKPSRSRKGASRQALGGITPTQAREAGDDGGDQWGLREKSREVGIITRYKFQVLKPMGVQEETWCQRDELQRCSLIK
jgi:hypothetical protein